MTIKWSERQEAYAEIAAACPFIDLALVADDGSFFPLDQLGTHIDRRRFPVMLRLRGMSPAEFAAGRAFFPDVEGQERWRRRVKVPALYTEGDMRGRTRIVCTAFVTRWFFEEMARNRALRAAVVRVTIGAPLRNESMPAFEAEPGEAAR